MQLTSFVGRRAELKEVSNLLAEARLVTLTGSGGAGKTRLAIQVGAEMLGEFPDGVWLVELAPVSDPDQVSPTVAHTLGMPEQAAGTPTDALARYLDAKRALLVFDNCEQVVDACAALAEALLRACEKIVVLATRREPLGIVGELAWQVPSLSLPEVGEPAPIGGVGTSEAVQLFAERAALARRGFAVTDGNAAAVAEICCRLDGIPLAIELAAARVKVFAPEQIASGLEDRFRLLTGGGRTAVPRQQTLRASVEWSHDLLTQPERLLFRRIGAFVGDFDFAAAETVCGGDGLEAHQVLDQLALLVDKSLVVVDDTSGEARYHLLETVRQFAAECLHDAGEEVAVRCLHRDHYLAIAEEAAAAGRVSDHSRWIERLAAELDNLRAAFWWSHNRGDAEHALRLATAISDLAIERTHFLEIADWFDITLSAADLVDPVVRLAGITAAALLDGAGVSFGGWARADEAIALARESGDDGLLGNALCAAALARRWFPDLVEPLITEGLGIARDRGDKYLIARFMMSRVTGLATIGEAGTLLACAKEGLAAADQSGTPGPRSRSVGCSVSAW